MKVRTAHALRALYGVSVREVVRFSRQYGRLASAVVRPALWLFVLGTGFRSVFGAVEMAPYPEPVPYPVYLVPGLLCMTLLFNGMQSSLSLVYDREMGIMRLLLTAPLPRWYLLLAKLVAGTVLSVLQAYAFLVICYLVGIDLPLAGLARALPALFVVGFSLGALGLLLSVNIRQLENFAGTMNFVIFPMFFLSSALNPLQRFIDGGAPEIAWIALANPFTHGVELVRYALYGEVAASSLVIVLSLTALFFILAAIGYDPQRGILSRRPGGR